jgi:NAD-dependent DNA ligase
MKNGIDADGQPHLRINQDRRMTRAMHELVGFLRGIVADEHINPQESERLAKWLVGNREIADEWPVNILVQRIEQIYKDEIADEEERADLAVLINGMVGRQDEDTFEFSPTDLPLTRPAPDVVFDMNEFVFTGKFFYGTRKACQREIEMRGGRCADNIRLQTSYLVVGSLMSRDWKYSAYGNKILKAVEYSSRCPIAVISERHWESFLLSKASGAASD